MLQGKSAFIMHIEVSFSDLDYRSFHVFSLQEAFTECLLHAGYWTLVV